MKTLYLHIGHQKTGTTYLQSVFTASRDQMAQAGIEYPVWGDDLKIIDPERQVPCGNGRDVLKGARHLRQVLAQAPMGQDKSVFFSSETLVTDLNGITDLGWIAQEASAAGFDQTLILLFLRAPLSHGVSIWQQALKGWQGETRPLNDWLAEIYDAPAATLQVIKTLGSVKGVELTVLNYDILRTSLSDEIARWLGVDPSVFVAPDMASPNRSLTRGEAELQRQMNKVLGQKSGDLFAFPLVHRLPEIARDPPRVTPQAAQAMLARHKSALDGLDSYLPEGQKLSRALPKDVPDTPYSFTTDQLDIIAQGVRKKLQSRPAARPSLLRRLKRRVGKIIRS